MYVIAYSSLTRTEWLLVEGNIVIERAETLGLNPYFLSRREISHIIRLELPESFFRRRWDHVYFYGAGCSSETKNHIVESSVVAQFKTPVSVMSNLLGAARGMLGDRPGLVAILSTGANSCFYDGASIAKNVKAGGFILGDEGSNSYLGKMLLSDILKRIAPQHIIEGFYSHFDTNSDDLMDAVYSNPMASSNLARYSGFLAENIDDEYCLRIVREGLMTFFSRNIAQYDYASHPISFVGTTGVTYRSILKDTAARFGATISDIALSPIAGLVTYHATH